MLRCTTSVPTRLCRSTCPGDPDAQLPGGLNRKVMENAGNDKYNGNYYSYIVI